MIHEKYCKINKNNNNRKYCPQQQSKWKIRLFFNIIDQKIKNYFFWIIKEINKKKIFV